MKTLYNKLNERKRRSHKSSLMKWYILCSLVLVILLIIAFIVTMTQKTEFGKIKVQTTTEIPGFLKERELPERGLYFYTDGNYPKGEIVVDIDEKVMNYNLIFQWKTEEKEGTRTLTNAQLKKIVAFANKIWASESEFETESPSAAATITHLVLIDNREYRILETSLGAFGGEADQLHRYLLRLVSEKNLS